MYKVTIRPLSVAASATEVVVSSYFQVLMLLVQMRKAFESTYRHLGQPEIENGDGDDILLGLAATADEQFTPVLVVNIDELPQEPDSNQQPTLA